MKKTIKNTHWDILIIGGGATGIGAAIDAASRGYKTLLVERDDYGKGTSSKSTKLIHGGVRYLQQGNFSLVLEALKERAILKRNAPHIVHDLKFVVPTYDWWESPFYGIGLKLYDWLAGKEGFGDSEFLSKEETVKYIPTVSQEGLRGGVIYHDGQFDDTRLLVNMMQTAKEQGAVILNYTEFLEFKKNDQNVICGAVIQDVFSKEKTKIKTKSIINATGVFSDSIRQKDEPSLQRIISSSQGVHIVLDKEFLPGNTAIMIPDTEDGRVLFAVPWHDKILIGTTDTPVSEYTSEPLPKKDEINFLLTHAAKYLTMTPTKKDVRSIFVGLRPLVKNGNAENTAEISREHVIEISKSGLISIAGGKWTTYRKMAEDVIDKATMVALIPFVKSETEFLNIHGYCTPNAQQNLLAIYGTDAKNIEELTDNDPELAVQIHPDYPFIKAQIIWAAQQEDAKTIEDVLARRIRFLFLDAKASIDSCELVANLLAGELGKDKDWIQKQITDYTVLAKQYIL